MTAEEDYYRLAALFQHLAEPLATITVAEFIRHFASTP